MYYILKFREVNWDIYVYADNHARVASYGGISLSEVPSIISLLSSKDGTIELEDASTSS